MFDLEKQIAAWRKGMIAAGIKSPARLDELESHLREQFAQLRTVELSDAQRFQIAIGELGDPRALKREFAKADRERFWAWRERPFTLYLVALWLIIAGSNAFRLLCRFAFSPQFRGPSGLISQSGLFDWRVLLFLGPLLLISSQMLMGVGLFFRFSLARRCFLGWVILMATYFFGSQLYLIITTGTGSLMNASSLGLVVKGGTQVYQNYYFLGMPLPLVFLPIISFFNLALFAWSFYFLTRPNVRRLFDRESETECAAES